MLSSAHRFLIVQHKLVVYLFVDEETNGSGLNGLANLSQKPILAQNRIIMCCRQLRNIRFEYEYFGAFEAKLVTA